MGQDLQTMPRRRSAARARRRSRGFSKELQRSELPADAHRIVHKFHFASFREALSFVEGVGELAEAEGHHPEICFRWGYAKVSLQTKKIMGRRQNDFIMAVKIDRLSDQLTRASVADPNKYKAPRGLMA